MNNEVQMKLGKWRIKSSKEQILERVEKEGMVAWALRESEPHRVIPPMPPQGWQPAPFHALLSKILP
jgi:hypothetical protein